MDFVKYHAEATYDRFAPALVKDPGAILRGAIRLLIDPNPAVHEETFKRFGVTNEINRETLLRMFEMVRGRTGGADELRVVLRRFRRA